MATQFERLKEKLKRRNNQRQQSSLELWVLRWFNTAKIYDYELEYQIDYYFLDIAFPKIKFGIELDGAQFHKDYKNDKKRDNYLIKKGWNIYRIPSSECWNPKLLFRHLEHIFFKIQPNNFLPYAIIEMNYDPEQYIKGHLNYYRYLKEKKFENYYCGYCKKCGQYYFNNQPCGCK